MKRQRDSHLVGTLLVAAVLLAGCGSSPTYSPTEVSTTYPPTKAVQRGDVVVGPDGKIGNLSAFTSFFDHLAHHKTGSVQITSYTTEGDPIFVDLSYDGTLLWYTYDNSRDKFGGQNKGRNTTTCTWVSAQRAANGTTYSVTGCKDTTMPSQILFISSSQR